MLLSVLAICLVTFVVVAVIQIFWALSFKRRKKSRQSSEYALLMGIALYNGILALGAPLSILLLPKDVDSANALFWLFLSALPPTLYFMTIVWLAGLNQNTSSKS